MKANGQCWLGKQLGPVHTTALAPERFRNATERPCSHLFHWVRSLLNERCDRSGTVPEQVRLALWCERTTGRVPVATRYSPRASVFPFQNCVNSVSGFSNSVFYRFRFYKFRFLPFQIFIIPFHFFQAVFLVSIIFC